MKAGKVSGEEVRAARRLEREERMEGGTGGGKRGREFTRRWRIYDKIRGGRRG